MNEEERFFPLVVLSIWMMQPRKCPLVIRGEGKIPMGAGRFSQHLTSVALFDDLVAEVNRVFGTPREEIEKAYRVWQLSRKPGDAKAQATTPKFITMKIANAFLGVLTRARTDREVARVASQRPAPVMFEFDRSSIGLKQGVSTNDSSAVIAGAAASLMRQIERLLSDHSLANIVPSAGGIFESALPILVKAQGGTCSDADIVELGMDFNALQWHVNSVNTQIFEATLGELTGLFSSMQIFLARFKAWREFEAAPDEKATNDPESFEIAVSLLQGARQASRLFTPEANMRIEAVLDRAEDQDAPGQEEGIVRSGENLAVITAESLGRIAVERATSAGAADGQGAAMEQYVRDHASDMKRLATRRNWPWLNWLQALLG
jgi:hypothetical protein